ncbi:Rrp15 protein [Martiniozyma asiatica (nom. inval.)]|nr:Rrp15 protein [Martiniozyma asiatica]
MAVKARTNNTQRKEKPQKGKSLGKRQRDESHSDNNSSESEGEGLDLDPLPESKKQKVKTTFSSKSGSDSDESFAQESEAENNIHDNDSDSVAGSEPDSEAEFDENDIPIPKKQSKKSTTSSDAFSSAMNALLGTHLKAHDRSAPILARSKQIGKKIESDKLEQKAKRVLLAQKRAKLTSSHKSNLLPTNDEDARSVLEHERKLKKVAQKGVIKLFNAIMMTQAQTTQELGNIQSSGVLGNTKKKELVNEISKDKFLDLVQQAGKK